MESEKVKKTEIQLFPEDSYIGETYWADLPFAERSRWMLTQQMQEDAREWSNIWREFVKDPAWPLLEYGRRYIIPGMGLFTEGYVLFSIGNLTTLFTVAYPDCWKTFKTCSKTLTQTTTYLQIVGIIIGQVVVGFFGDWLGRRYGMIQDAAIMTLGALMLTVSNGTDARGWVIMYAISQLVYGIGVGGEYPMTGATTCEVAEPGSREDKLHRGRTVVLAFTMQGWGQFVNIGVLLLSVLVFNGHAGPPYDRVNAGTIWRFSFGFILLFIIWLLYYRIYHLKGVDRELVTVNAANKVEGYDWHSFGLLMTFYWHRIVGTAGGWFCNDFMFYGNKIFQGQFIAVISPHASVTTNWLWTMCNVGVELAGYYLAALTIDWKFYGRTRMQAVGFLMDFILFIIPAGIYRALSLKSNIGIFQFIYFFSSFWNQFGPNCTTFLLAAEVFPASVRATGHGISAATGKLGALAPTIIYNYLPKQANRTRFWIVCWFGLTGFILTVLFVPDTTGLDLREQERRWKYIREGRGHEYHGIAIHPRHLSWWEMYVLGYHKNYNPQLDDREDRLAVLSQLAGHDTDAIGDNMA